MKELQEVLEKYVTLKDCLTNSEDLLYMNRDLEMSGTDIGKVLHVSSTTVQKSFSKLNITLKRTGKKLKGSIRINDVKKRTLLNDKKYLIMKHHDEQVTINDLAKEIGVQRSTLISRFRHYDISVRRYNKSIIKKREFTMQERYGFINAGQVEHLIKNKHHTMQDRYGVNNYSELLIPDNIKTLLLDKNWLYHQHHDKQKSAVAISEELNVSDGTIRHYLKYHDIEVCYFTSSREEMQIVDFLKSFNIKIQQNVKNIITPYELDIYLPDYNLAIEYNGLYWHSEAGGKDSKYHLNKTTLCEKKQIRLIHIFEDEWKQQQSKCKETLTHILKQSPKGSYGRNVKIEEISWKTAKNFLNKYHLLSSGTCGNYRIGAFNRNNDLIGVMVFGNSSSEGTKEIELKRFVTDKNNNPGLGSKMFKYAIQKQQYNEVVAFVDRRWFTGLVKDYIGFKKIGETSPALWWTNGKDQRLHRRHFTKKQLVKQGFDPMLSKRKMLLSQKYCRIWDCGKIKVQWKKHD